MTTRTDAPDPVLNTADAAALLGTSKAYLAKLRVTGGGPPFLLYGRAVRYRTSDLRAWMGNRSRASTAEARANP
jgi:predicted DNA-binding transcriptional regulator AlpA